MSFNNYANSEYTQMQNIDRIYKLLDSTSKDLNLNTRELGELTKVIEALSHELAELKKQMEFNTTQSAITMEKHDIRIASLERFKAKINIAILVILSMIGLGSTILGYLYYF